MIYDILEQKLMTSGFVPGVSLFRHNMPGPVEIGVLIREPLSGIKVDHETPNYYRGRLQVITRHVDPVLGRQMAHLVQDTLKVDSLESYSASAERGKAHITYFWPDTLPVQFPRLEGNGYEWSQHFLAAFGFKPV